VGERRLLPPEARAFCEARYQGGDYARPEGWRDPVRYRGYCVRAIEPTNKKRRIAAFEYLWLEQAHPDLVKYHQPSRPVPRNGAESLRDQREKADRIRGEWNPAREDGSQRLLGGIPARAFLVAGGFLAAFATRGDAHPSRDGAIILGAMAGALLYGVLWGLHTGFLAMARHRRLVATVRRQVEHEDQQILERFLDEMHRAVNLRLQPYRR